MTGVRVLLDEHVGRVFERLLRERVLVSEIERGAFRSLLSTGVTTTEKHVDDDLCR